MICQICLKYLQLLSLTIGFTFLDSHYYYCQTPGVVKNTTNIWRILDVVYLMFSSSAMYCCV